jgi:hypothetical protein
MVKGEQTMANYSVTNGSTSGGGTQQAVTTTFVSAIISVAASSINGGLSPLRRGKIYDVLVGTPSTPGDTALEFDISRITATSTTTNVNALNLQLDPADAQPSTQIMINSSQAGTITASQQVWYVGMNQRASYRWVFAPGSELVWPATASNGLTMRARSGSYVGLCTGTVMFQEQ